MQRSLKLLGMILGSLTMLATLVVGCFIALLYTPTGARLVGDVVSHYVPQVRLISLGLSGRSVVVEAVALRDSKGIWLHANGITLTPDWLGLLAGRIGIDDFSMHELAFIRLPEAAPPTEDSSFTFPELPTFELVDALPHMYAKRLHINAIHVATPLLPVEKTFRLDGAFNINLHHAGESFAKLAIGLPESEQSGLWLNLSPAQHEFHIRNDMATLLGNLVGLPDDKQLVVDLTTTPKQNMAWSGKITATAQDLLQHEMQLDMPTLAPLELQISGTNSSIENAYLSFNYTINTLFDFKENIARLDTLRVTGSGINMQAQGHYQTDDGDLQFKANIDTDIFKAPGRLGCPDCQISNLKINLEAQGEAPYPDYAFDTRIARLGMDGVGIENLSLTASAKHTHFSRTEIPYNIEADLQTTATLYAPGADALAQLSGPLTASYKDNMLRIKANLDGQRDMAFNADFNWPLPLTTNLDALSRSPLEGQLKGQLLLGPIVRLLGMAEHRARGLVTLDATLGGNAKNPQINGTLQLRNAFYENLIYGTKLTDISADAAWEKDRLEVKSLSLKDGANGHTSGSGYMSLREANRIAYSFKLDAQSMLLVNTGGLVVNSSGNLSFEGHEKAATLEGQINLHRAELYLTQLPTGVSGFDKYEIVSRDEAHHAPPTQIQSSDFNLTLNLNVSAPGNISARALGLESDWGTRLEITGTADNPRLNGNLFLRRGRLELASLMVELTRGDISFHGAPDNPSLDIRGDIRGKGTDANLLIGGTAEIPTFTLRNASDLPPEEIVSQILFGEATTNLTPFQALQIAQVLATLTGQTSGGLNPLDALRRKTGLDTLSISYDDATGTSSVAAGKYLSDRVYVGVEQGNTPGSSSVVTEISVNRRLSVETAVGGPSQDAKAGLKWRWDY